MNLLHTMQQYRPFTAFYVLLQIYIHFYFIYIKMITAARQLLLR